MEKLLKGFIICLVTGLINCPVGLMAQAVESHPVGGTVVSSEDGSTIPGVTVLEKGTSNGTITDMDGRYQITVSGPASTLVFSYVGYIATEANINHRSIVDISLESDLQQLSEVVVVGYGTQEKREITGSISTVNADRLTDMPSNHIGLRLQGQVPGVQINQTSGEPGGNLAFRIRGAASINAGNSPLVVLDGFPIQAGLSTISPDEIESISVLKDASASALYGSRAANGVILVTTKGAKDGRTNIEFSSYFGVEMVGDRGKPDLMNAREFAQYKKEYYEDQARYEGYTGGVPERYQNPEQYGENDGTNWYDILLRDALTQNYNLSLSSGVQNLKSSVNVNYNNQEGVILNTFFERFNVRANNTYTASDNLTFGLNLSGSYRNSQITPGLGDGRNIIGSAFLMDPTINYRNEDGTLPLSFASPGMFPNPNYYRVVTERVHPRKQTTALANFFGEYKIIEGLKYKFSANADLGNDVNRSFIPSTAGGAMFTAPPVPATGNYNTGNYLTWLVENTINYTKSINDSHHFDVLVGHTAQKSTSESSGINATQFPDDEVEWINAAATRIGTANMGEWAIESYIGRLNYNFNSKYLLSMSIRRDGSSRFGADSRWGTFPSISAGWVVSDESFMRNFDKINYLKLRASYGQLGNYNIGNYTHLASATTINYVLSDAIAAGRALDRIQNNELTWETTEQLDIGLDLMAFNGRINFTYDYYRKNTEGLLYAIDIPRQTGFASISSNIGEFLYWGHELGLETKNFTGNFNWTTNLNISFNRNKAVQLGTNNTPIGGQANAGVEINRTQVGHPIGQFYGFVYDGVYMTEEEFNSQPKHALSMVGTARYKDISGPDGIPDGIIDDYDKTIIGDPNPDFIYGITNQFSYKNFDLNIVLAGSYGNDVFDNTREWTENLDGVFNVRKEVAERWRSLEEPGNGNIARTRSGTTSLSRWHTSRFIFDASYLAAKNITLGYTVPLANNKYVKNVRVYASARNAFIITKYPGMNPEVSTFGLSALSQGVDVSSYPVPVTLTLGTNINF